MKRVKKMLAGIVIACGACAAQAAGAYDGIWATSLSGLPVGYFSIHQNGNSLVVASMPMAGSGTVAWEAFIGTISGSSAIVDTIVSGTNARWSVQFTSATEGTATQISCTPKTSRDSCDFPNGTVLRGIRIF